MKLSIITVTYNSRETLEDTIRSILSQTYQNVEYIIVDGLSKDNTIEVIKKHEAFFVEKQLRWFSERDGGLYDAMNKGIQMATGDIIGILNSDDFFTSDDVLEKVAAEFEKGVNIDAVYGDIHYVKPDNLMKCIRYYSSEVFTRKRMRMGFMPAHPSFYVRRNCYQKYGLYKTDYSICADFELLLRFIYVNNIEIKYLPMDMVTMRIGGVSTNGLRSHLKILKQHLRALKENCVSTNIFLLSLRYLYKLTEFYK